MKQKPLAADDGHVNAAKAFHSSCVLSPSLSCFSRRLSDKAVAAGATTAWALKPTQTTFMDH